MPPTVTVPAGYDTDASILKAELKIYLGTGLIISNITQPDLGSATGAITASGGAPATTQDGRAWWHTGGAANGPDRYLTAYDSAQARDITPPINSMDWASLPATGTVGERVYVTDLQITVEYRDAAADALLCGTGLAGWHPTESGLMLVENNTGADITKGHAVAFVGTTGTRRVQHTTVIQQGNFAGVALHTFATTLKGIIAGPGFNRPVSVYCLGVSFNVATNDIIACAGPGGNCRTVGPDPATIALPALYMSVRGTYLGGFARALTDSAVDGLVCCQLIGFVGQGCTFRTRRTTITTFDNANRASIPTNGLFGTQIYAVRSASGVAGGQAGTNDLLLSSKNVPVAAFIDATVTLELSGAAAVDTLSVGTNGTDANASIRDRTWSAAGLMEIRNSFDGPVPIDSVFKFYYANDTAGATINNNASNEFSLAMTGFVC